LGRPLTSNSNHSNHRKDSKQQVTSSPSYSKGISSPTLAELNTVAEGPRTKRANTAATSSSYISPYSPSPPPISSSHLYNSVSDSSSSVLHPRLAFNERESFDELNSSFRSLYKSLFGHSVPHQGEYFNTSASEDRNHMSANLPGSIPNNGLTLSDSNGSLSLGASAGTFLNSVSNPQFTSLMGSFRDIAETNSWDKLDPAQIQGLVDSFKTCEHSKFGLDHDAYADLHASFNQFLSQLNNKFLTGSSNANPQLADYSQQPSQLARNRASFQGPVMLSGTIESLGPPHAHKHHLHHKIDTVAAPSPLLSMHHQHHHHGTSPPTNFHLASNRTPSPGTGCSSHDQLVDLATVHAPNPMHPPSHYQEFISAGNAAGTFNSAANPNGDAEGLNLQSPPFFFFFFFFFFLVMHYHN